MDVRLESTTNEEFAVIRSSSCSISVQAGSGVFQSCRSDVTSETSTYARRDLSIVVLKAHHSDEPGPQSQNRNTQNRRGGNSRSPRSHRNEIDANIVRNLPDEVLSLIDSPHSETTSPKSARSSLTRPETSWFLNIFLKILRDLQSESNLLIRLESEGVALTSGGSSPLLDLINECFLNDFETEADSPHSNYSQSEINKLVIECLQILEKSIHKQAKDIKYLAERNPSFSEARVAKKMLKSIMLNVQNELNQSNIILEIVNSGIHNQAFKFIFGLLKHFVEKSTSLLRIGSNITIKSSGNVESGHYSNIDADYTHLADHRLEEFTERLDRLLEKWGDEKDPVRQSETRSVIIDCYHCHTKCKKQELLLKTVSQFTEEMKNELITHVKSNRQENRYKCPNEIKETNSSNDTIRSEEISTLESSTNRHLCQDQNFPQPKCLPAVSQFRQQSYFGRNASYPKLIRNQTFQNANSVKNEIYLNKTSHAKCYQGLLTIGNKEEEQLQKKAANGRCGSTNNNCTRCHRKTTSSGHKSLEQKISPPASCERGDFGRRACSYEPPRILESYPVQPVYSEQGEKKQNTTTPEDFDSASKRKISVVYDPAKKKESKENTANQVKKERSDPSDRALTQNKRDRKESKNEAKKRASVAPPPVEQSEDAGNSRNLMGGGSSKKIPLEKTDETGEEPNALTTSSWRGRKKSKAENARRASTMPVNDRGLPDKKRVSVMPEPLAAYSDNSGREFEPVETRKSKGSKNGRASGYPDEPDDKVVAQKSGVKEIVIQERVDPRIVEYLLGKEAQDPTTTSPKPILVTSNADCNKEPPKESKPQHCCRLSCKCSNKKQAEKLKKSCCRGACTCVPTTNLGAASVMFAPCQCKQAGPQNLGDLSSRPIYQFFTNPMPISCNCPGNPRVEEKTVVCSDLSTSTSDPCTLDVETQTSKKKLTKSTGGSSTGVSSTPSKTDGSSSSCECSPASSEGCTKYGVCSCPGKIEEMFQDFDEKYSKVIRELKCLIKEGYIPLSTDGPYTQPKKPLPCKPPRVELHPCTCKKQEESCTELEQQPKTLQQKTAQYVDPMYQDLQREIECLKQMVKNTSFGQCICCKCCKCGPNGEATPNTQDCQEQAFHDDQAKKVHVKPPTCDEDSSSQVKKDYEKLPDWNNEPSNQAKKGFQKPQLSGDDPSPHQVKRSYEKTPSCDSELDIPTDASVIQASPSQVKLQDEKLPISAKWISPTPKQLPPKQLSPTYSQSTARYSIASPTQQEPLIGISKTSKMADPNYKPEMRRSLLFQEPEERSSALVNQGNIATDGEAYGGLESQPVTQDPQQMVSSVGPPDSPSQSIRYSVASSSRMTPLQRATASDQQQNARYRAVSVSKMAPLQQGTYSEENERIGSTSVANERMASPQQEITSQGTDRIGSISVASQRMASPQQATSSPEKESFDNVSVAHRRMASLQQAGSANVEQSTGEAQFVASSQKIDSQQLLTDPQSLNEPNSQAQFVPEGSKQGRLIPRNRRASTFDTGEGAEYRALYSSRENLIRGREPPEPSSDEGEFMKEREEKSGTHQGSPDYQVGGPRGQGGKQRGTHGQDGKSGGPQGGDGKMRPHDRDGKPGPQGRAGKPEGPLYRDEKPGRSQGPAAKKADADEDQKEITQDDVCSKAFSPHRGRDGDGEEDSCEDECSSDENETDSVLSAIDECQSILDAVPCTFFSDSSSTESSVTEEANVENNCGNELYVMIIQPQIDPSTEDIVKTVLSNNAEKPSTSIISTNSDYNTKNKYIDHSTDQDNSHDQKKISEKSWKETKSQHRIIQQLLRSRPYNSDFVAKEPSPLTSFVDDDETIKTNNKRRVKNWSYPVKIDKVRKISEMSRKSRERRRSGGDLKSQETLKKTSEKEVQVTKWNAKVQTAGPRKFNRTDISREVEDRLAKYLGLERTIDETNSTEAPSTEMTGVKRRSSAPGSRDSKKKVTSKSRK